MSLAVIGGSSLMKPSANTQKAVGIFGGPEALSEGVSSAFFEGSSRARTAFAANMETVSKDALIADSGDSVFAASALSADEEQKPVSGFYRYRTVKGDTLASLAKKFSLAESTLLAVNPHISSKSLRRGTTLSVPPMDGKSYVALEGETLSSIAAKFQTAQIDIAAVNEGAASLEPGQRIFIPGLFDATKEDIYNKTPVALFSPAQGKNWGIIHAHNAVDISNLCGTPVVSAAPGVVVADEKYGDGEDDWNGGYGKFVLVEHFGGIRTRYAHLRRTAVSVGDAVRRGQKIGEMGDTGVASQCHLHFEVYGAANPFAAAQ